MDFLALKAELTSGDAASRKEVWRSLPRGHAEHPFFSGELSKLRVLLYKEADLDVRTTGAICLEEMLHMPGAPQGESFHDWLFHSFRHTHAESKAALKRSLVLTVCDNEYVRDVHALVEVARHLPTDRYPQTVFRHVALHSPDWADVGLNHAGAICFIGRPFIEVVVNVLIAVERYRIVVGQQLDIFQSGVGHRILGQPATVGRIHHQQRQHGGGGRTGRYPAARERRAAGTACRQRRKARLRQARAHRSR